MQDTTEASNVTIQRLNTSVSDLDSHCRGLGGGIRDTQTTEAALEGE
jgi:hypothetical protein